MFFIKRRTGEWLKHKWQIVNVLQKYKHIKKIILISLSILFSFSVLAQSSSKLNDKIFDAVKTQIKSVNELYIDLHKTPEL